MAQKHYDMDYKVQAVKLANEIGLNKAAKEIGVSSSTLHGWVKASLEGRIDLGPGTKKPSTALSLSEEIAQLRAENKVLAKENKRLKEENEFLEEASAFFAASRRKSARTKD